MQLDHTFPAFLLYLPTRLPAVWGHDLLEAPIPVKVPMNPTTLDLSTKAYLYVNVALVIVIAYKMDFKIKVLFYFAISYAA